MSKVVLYHRDLKLCPFSHNSSWLSAPDKHCCLTSPHEYDRSYSHAIFAFSLVYLTWHNILKVNLYCSMCQNFLFDMKYSVHVYFVYSSVDGHFLERRWFIGQSDWISCRHVYSSPGAWVKSYNLEPWFSSCISLPCSWTQGLTYAKPSVTNCVILLALSFCL